MQIPDTNSKLLGSADAKQVSFGPSTYRIANTNFTMFSEHINSPSTSSVMVSPDREELGVVLKTLYN